MCSKQGLRTWAALAASSCERCLSLLAKLLGWGKLLQTLLQPLLISQTHAPKIWGGSRDLKEAEENHSLRASLQGLEGRGRGAGFGFHSPRKQRAGNIRLKADFMGPAAKPEQQPGAKHPQLALLWGSLLPLSASAAKFGWIRDFHHPPAISAIRMIFSQLVCSLNLAFFP